MLLFNTSRSAFLVLAYYLLIFPIKAYTVVKARKNYWNRIFFEKGTEKVTLTSHNQSLIHIDEIKP